MFEFPKKLYTDIRIEDVFETKIQYTLGNLEESKVRKYRAAFIRVFDGSRWYYAVTSDEDSIQSEIERLASMAEANDQIHENSIVKQFQVNTGTHFSFEENSVSNVGYEKKTLLLKSLFPIISSSEMIKIWTAEYLDSRKVIEFYSSKGANLMFDTQKVGISVALTFKNGDKKLNERYQKGEACFEALINQEVKLKKYIENCEAFLKNSKPVEPGKYTVILSPIAAGVFAHESFGHKSEADFMVGDETMKQEWTIGTRVGPDMLSIMDTGTEPGSGFVPFDDEGTKATSTYLVKDGKLSGRLHSASTAASLEECVTGNARALDYTFEPIVRMTNTYILPGNKTKEELISEVKDGLFVETVIHGSGMSTFTIAPSMSYRIINGKISDPVNISVITGNVFETLAMIDGLSDKLEIISAVRGGCGKGEQFPLPVGLGGPYVRVKSMNVQ